jgi:hypothetical protein
VVEGGEGRPHGGSADTRHGKEAEAPSGGLDRQDRQLLDQSFELMFEQSFEPGLAPQAGRAAIPGRSSPPRRIDYLRARCPNRIACASLSFRKS